MCDFQKSNSGCPVSSWPLSIQTTDFLEVELSLFEVEYEWNSVFLELASLLCKLISSLLITEGNLYDHQIPWERVSLEQLVAIVRWYRSRPASFCLLISSERFLTLRFYKVEHRFIWPCVRHASSISSTVK